MAGFSVLMAVYHKDDPLHFEAALNSVLAQQTLPPNELVLVCDGPLNVALDAVIGAFSNRYPNILRVYRLAENGGLGKALNYGLSKCSNEIVARADSDDICVNDRFEQQIKFMTEHSDVAAVGSDIDEFSISPNNPVHIKRMPSTHEEITKLATVRNPINHMTVAFRKSSVLKAGSYIHLPYVEDYYLWLRMIANGFQLANINKVLVHARIGNGMVERRGNPKYIPSWRILQKYMIENNMISRIEYIKNMILILGFVYMPVSAKKKAYSTLLRGN